MTIDDASEAIPGIDDTAAWIERHVAPAAEVSGRAMHRWVDVVAALDRTRSRFPDSAEPAIEGYEAAAALLSTSATTLRRILRSEGLPDELRPKNKSAGVKNCRPWWTGPEECRAWYERLTRWLALPAPPPQRAPRKDKLRRGALMHEGPVDFAAHARHLSEHGSVTRSSSAAAAPSWPRRSSTITAATTNGSTAGPSQISAARSAGRHGP